MLWKSRKTRTRLLPLRACILEILLLNLNENHFPWSCGILCFPQFCQTGDGMWADARISDMMRSEHSCARDQLAGGGGASRRFACRSTSTRPNGAYYDVCDCANSPRLPNSRRVTGPPDRTLLRSPIRARSDKSDHPPARHSATTNSYFGRPSGDFVMAGISGISLYVWADRARVCICTSWVVRRQAVRR
jgi:hypothetical protein